MTDVTESASIRDELDAIKKELKAAKEESKQTDIRLGALQIFVGAYLALYLTLANDRTVNPGWWALLAFIVAGVLVFLFMGVGRRVTMSMMDVLTTNWEYQIRSK